MVGVPAELKSGETRVGLTPDGAHELSARGVDVLVESGAGECSGQDDEAYLAAGAKIVPRADEVWARADLIVKVKEPQPGEFHLIREGQVVFTYLHLAAYPFVTDALVRASATGIAYETVQ